MGGVCPGAFLEPVRGLCPGAVVWLTVSNVLIGEDGPQVIDFGIFRTVESTALTQAGLVDRLARVHVPRLGRRFEIGPPTDMLSLGGRAGLRRHGRRPVRHRDHGGAAVPRGPRHPRISSTRARGAGYGGLGGLGQVQEELAVLLVKPYLSLRADVPRELTRLASCSNSRRRSGSGYPGRRAAWPAALPSGRAARGAGRGVSTARHHQRAPARRGAARARLVSSKACMNARISTGFSRTPRTSPSSNRPEESSDCRAAASAAGSITNPRSVTVIRRWPDGMRPATRRGQQDADWFRG